MALVRARFVALFAAFVLAPTAAYAEDEPPPEQPPVLALPPIEAVPQAPEAVTKAPFDPPYLADPGLGDWLVIGAAGSLAIASAVIAPQSKHSTGGVLFDESVRNALRLKSADARYEIRDASDVGLSLEVTWPFLVDALFTAWYHRGNPALARRMAVVDAQALAIVGGLQELTTGIASRERPYARDCGTTLPEESVDCTGNVRYRSFFSGHSSLTFASASLVCVHHLEAGLLGAPWDALSCATAYGVAATTAMFRMMGDMHYATDVITGAIIGTAVGISIPLVHAHRGESDDTPKVGLIPVGAGLGLGGVF